MTTTAGTIASSTSRSTGSAFQPSLEDLGTPLDQVRFCVVDLETTGGGPEAAITEFGAVLIQGGEVLGEFSTLVNPDAHIPAMITVLTGITDAMVVNMPKIDEVLPSFLTFANGAVLVAHNARFDVGFLKRAAADLGYPWPNPRVIDTVALARHALLRDEVPNVKLSTLAAHFHTAVQPDHRALSDARATVDVLYGLFERVGNLGVATLEDLEEFTAHVSPQRRAKRVWAKALPDEPGVYWFYANFSNTKHPDEQGREVLYVGKSINLRKRVASYFTAAESRARMDEMVRIAAGVDYVVCATDLEAEVRELRLINAHDPHFNSKSRRQLKVFWLKLTGEKYPRLSIVRAVKDDGCVYWGPFTSRITAEQASMALQDAWGLRNCTGSMSKCATGGCMLASLQRCIAPCVQPDVAAYHEAVESVQTALQADIRPTLERVGARIGTLAAQERFEDAAVLNSRLVTYADTVTRWNRLTTLAAIPEIVAAKLVGERWQIHVIRHGMLAGAAAASPGCSPLDVAETCRAFAATVLPGPAGLPSCTIEEAERVAAWLELDGVRLISITGTWAWPLRSGTTPGQLPALILGQRQESAASVQVDP
jgi:DNA polymerase-3 subunit epsilon